MELFLRTVAPKLLAGQTTFNIINYQGKSRMLAELPNRLRAYRKRMDREDIRLVILIDKDNADCAELKRTLEEFARNADIPTKAHPSPQQSYSAITRIVIHELEAWYFGDVQALRAAFPGVPASLAAQQPYREPDAIQNAWESLHRLLQRHGRMGKTFPKQRVACTLAPFMKIDENTSKSFIHFISGVRALIEATPTGKP